MGLDLQRAFGPVPEVLAAPGTRQGQGSAPGSGSRRYISLATGSEFRHRRGLWLALVVAVAGALLVVALATPVFHQQGVARDYSHGGLGAAAKLQQLWRFGPFRHSEVHHVVAKSHASTPAPEEAYAKVHHDAAESHSSTPAPEEAYTQVHHDAAESHSSTPAPEEAYAQVLYSRRSGMKVLKGVSYAPVPIKQLGTLVPDDDFMSPATSPLWGRHGRQDLRTIRALGADFVRLYGNDPSLDHQAFLTEAAANGMKVMAGMSDYPYLQMAGNCITTGYNCYAQIKEQYSMNLQKGFLAGTGKYDPTLGMVILMNEPDLKFGNLLKGVPGEPKHFCKAVVSAIDALLDAEKEAGVTGPVPNLTVAFSFAVCSKCKRANKPGLAQMLELRDAMHHPEKINYTSRNNLWLAYQTRFVNSFNTQNPAIDLRPIFLDEYEKVFRTTPVFITEYHSPGFFDQKVDLEGILDIAVKGSGLLIGISFFEFQVRYDKSADEHPFGIFGLGNDTVAGDFDIMTDHYASWCLQRQPTDTKLTRQCGAMPLDVEVHVEGANWNKSIHCAAAGCCCLACREHPHCHAWSWQRDGGPPHHDFLGRCKLMGKGPVTTASKRGVLSGVKDDGKHSGGAHMHEVVTAAFGGRGLENEQLCREEPRPSCGEGEACM